MKKLVLLSAVALLSAGTSARAQIVVSQQFSLYNDHDLSPTDVAGVVPAEDFHTTPDAGNSSDTHVVQTVSGTALSGYNLGTSSVVSTGVNFTLAYDATFQSSSSISDTNSTNDNHLLFGVYFNRFSDDTPSPLTAATLALSGLNPTDNYNLYVYYNAAFSNSGVSSTIALNGATPFTITNNTSLTSFQQSTPTSAVGNYVEFTGLTGSAVDSVAIATGTVGYTGFQLVDEGPAASAPEPSSVGLFALGLGALAFHFKRKRLAVAKL